MRTDVIVHDVASLRIDPAVLSRPDRDLALITTPAHAARLRQRGRQDVFAHVVVLDAFDPGTLTDAVEGLRGTLPEGDRGTISLLCHDEYSLELVAQVREKLGIAGDRPAQLRVFVDKVVAKQALRAAGVRLPRHLRWDAASYEADPSAYCAQVVDLVGLPAFAKPTNESGSVGTRRLDTADQLHQWAAAGRDGAWEVDEFIDGTLFHVDTAWQDGVAVHVAVNEDVHPCYDYTAGRINGSVTLADDDPVALRLRAFNARVLAALHDKPARSVFHHEVFLTGDDVLVFLEIAARAPAALIPSTSHIRYGFDIEEAHFRLQRGDTLAVPAADGPYAAYVYFPKPAGTVGDLRPAVLRSSHRWTWNVAAGDRLEAATDIRDFAASVLLWNTDLDALRDDLRLLDAHTPVQLA